MKIKSLTSQTITCLSITEKAIKLVQSQAEGSARRISRLQAISLKEKSDEEIMQGLVQIFKGQKQNDLGRFILLIPRQSAALHYSRLPSTNPDEIKEMARLQAAKQLPYEPQAIILGYQTIRVTAEGYSDIILIIVHQDIIKRYLKILEKIKLEPQEITLDSQGSYRFLKQQKAHKTGSPVMLVDLDSGSARLDIIASAISIYSRAFALAPPAAEYKLRLKEEINRSLIAYEKEDIGPKPESLFFTGAQAFLNLIDEDFSKGFAGRSVKYPQGQNIIFKTGQVVRKPDLEENSFASLLGMVLFKEGPAFNLLPEDILARKRKAAYQFQIRKAALLALLIIATTAVAMFFNISVKKRTLSQLNQQLQGLSAEADRIEKMAKKTKLIREQFARSRSCLEVLSEIFRIASSEISLASFSYDVNNSLTLKGQAKTLAGVFNFVNALEASDIFKDVQVRHSSKRKIKNEEVADFEIACPLEKK